MVEVGPTKGNESESRNHHLAARTGSVSEYVSLAAAESEVVCAEGTSTAWCNPAHIDGEEGPVFCVLSFLDVVSRQVRRIGRKGYSEGVVQVGHSRRVSRATKLDLAKPKRTSGPSDARQKGMGGGTGVGCGRGGGGGM